MNEGVNLYTISIDEFLLVNKNINDPVYKFCILNNIQSLGEFIDDYNYRYKNGKMTRYNNDYFHGVIDLIKLFYLNEPLRCNNLLLEEILLEEHPYRKNDIQARIQSEPFKEPLRRLGFTNNEKDVLLSYVVNKNKSMTVIDTLENCINDLKKHVFLSNKEYEVFLSKLRLLIKYYYGNSNEFINLPLYNYAEMKRLYQKRDELLLMKSKIENEINEVEKELKERLKYISVDDLQVLMKKI